MDEGWLKPCSTVSVRGRPSAQAPLACPAPTTAQLTLL